MKFNANKFFGFLGRVLEGFLKSPNDTNVKEGTKRAPAPSRKTSTQTTPGTKPRPSAAAGARNTSKPVQTNAASGLGWENGDYPGDFHGAVKPVYSPEADGQPDPGEIVWAWVPYEEDYSQGKDRPVLLIGNDGKYLLALMLTSKDRNNPGRSDNDYVDVGSGPWDKQGRPSEVKVDRLIRLLPSSIRREGAVLNKQLFSRVADRLAS